MWEAIALAAHQKLDNLVAIVDVNALGQSQRTMYGFDVEGYAARFASFGWHAIPIDGHDMPSIVAAFEEASAVREQPVAIIARTKKGQGVSTLADKDNWHGKPVQKGADLEKAVAEVRAAAPTVALPAVQARGAKRRNDERRPQARWQRPITPPTRRWRPAKRTAPRWPSSAAWIRRSR